MKKILITGANSYIGTCFKSFIEQQLSHYYVEELCVRGDSWKKYDFTKFDVVYHVAGLAHSTPNESQKDLYYEVNTELAYEVCLKAKEDNVKQFIFMSSIIVYGSGKVGEDRVITKDTPLTPDNFYGDSKKQAELKIQSLENEEFKIAIIRAPMIYGPNSKGNYSMFARFAKITPIFPTLENKRSMLFIGNLLEFIKLLIDNDEKGIFFPQNNEYVSSKDLIKNISEVHKHKIKYTKVFNPVLKLLRKQVYINKVFGNLTIEKELSNYTDVYCKYSLEESVKLTEESI